jgi:dipeptidyl-peptidase-3
MQMNIFTFSQATRLGSLRSVHHAIRRPHLWLNSNKANIHRSRRFINMNAQELSQYLADAPPSVVRLEIEKHFEALTDKQKAYAHHISR